MTAGQTGTEPVLSEQKPDAGLMVSVCFLLIAVPFAYSSSVFDSGLMPKFLVLMVGAFFVTLSWLRMEMRGEAFRTSLPTDLPIILYILIVAMQWPRAYDINQASLEVIKVLTLGIIYFAITRCSVDGHWRMWTKFLALVGSAVSVIGIGQYLGIAFLSLPSAGFPSATFGYRNIAAMFIVTVLPFAFLQFVRSKELSCDVLWAACWTAMSIFLIYTRTRGAWVGLLISLMGVTVLIGIRYGRCLLNPQGLVNVLRSSKALISLASILIIAAASPVPPSSVTDQMPQVSHLPPNKSSLGDALNTVVSSAAELQTWNPASGSGRVGIWLATLQMVGDHPFLGVGLSNWEKLYPLYQSSSHGKNRFARRPHNDYLWTLSELGVVGLLAYLGVFVVAVFVAVFTTKKLDIGSFGYAAAALGGICALQGHAFFSFPLERVGPLFAGWFCLALGASVCRSRQEFRPEPSRFARPVLSLLLVVLGTGVVVSATISEAMTASSVILLGQGKAEQALQSVNVARKWGVFDYRHLMYQSDISLAMGRLDSAHSLCKEVVRRNPNSPNGLRNLGKIAHALGRYDVAADSFERAIHLKSDHFDLHKDLGLSYEQMGDWESAIKTYERAQRKGIARNWVTYRLGDIHYRLSFAEKATEPHGSEDSGKSWGPNRSGDMHSNSGHLESAGFHFGASVLANPDFAPAHLGLANVLLRRGKTDDALIEYRKGLDLDPENPLTHYAIATLYLSKGMDSHAGAHFRKSLLLTDDETLRKKVLALQAGITPRNRLEPAQVPIPPASGIQQTQLGEK